jgi:hypothetical protein
MYVITRERFGLIPPPFSFFVLPPEIQAFLDKVRKSPKSFESLLLTVELHPDPIFLAIDPRNTLVDLVLMNTSPARRSAVAKMLLGALKTIFNQHKQQDSQFRRQVEAENSLASQLQQTTGKLPREKLTPFVLNAGLGPDSNLTVVGRKFADQMLATLRQAMSQSKVPNTHFFNLGRFLQKLFESLQKDPVFKRRVEIELDNRTIAMTKEFLRKSPVTSKPFLIEAALSSEANQGEVGKSFAAKSFGGSRLFERIVNSDAAEGIFMRLGIRLKVEADDKRTRDRAFDRLIKEEMQRRQLKQQQSKQKRRR